MPDQPHDDDRTDIQIWTAPPPVTAGRPAEPESDDAPTDQLPVITDEPPVLAAAGPLSSRRPGKGWWIALAAAAVVVLAVVGFYVVDLVRTSGEIERGTSIAGIDVGGLTPAQAAEALEREVGPAFRAAVILDVHGQQVQVDPQDAGLTPDIAGAVAAAGTRSTSPIARFGSFGRSVDVPLTVQVDRAALTDWLDGVARRTDVKAVDGSVSKRGTAVKTVDPVVGRHLDVDRSAAAIEKAWREGGPAAVNGLDLPATTEKVRVSEAGVATARARAEKILSGPLTVKMSVGTATISREQVARAVTITPDTKDGFTVTADSTALRAVVQDQVNGTQTSPKDATVALTDGKPTITPSVTGLTVNWDATEKTVVRALTSDNRVWSVVYEKKEPGFSTADAKALGLNEVIGEFNTGGFAYASGQNIKVVAEKVQGALVMPGKTFSLNGFTGPRTEADGYIPAGVIQDGVISTAVGGGISQFATTLYNASYFAGMGDVTHQPHSFYISRYPQGREATVFDGEIDLAFSNDYPTAVMIQTIWTDGDITVRIWGTKHVQVESVTSEPFDYTSPPTQTIPYGQDCSPSSGSSGFSVVNTRILKDLAGKEIRRENFTTVYNGQQATVCEPPPPTPTPATSASGSAPPASPPPSTPASR